MTGETALAPVRGRARIDILDILRGIAILGIYYMNVGFQAQSGNAVSADLRLAGFSTLADQRAAAFMAVVLEGTQRCLLEFLFGAGMMVLTAKAMKPDGPVAIADLYYRRTLWLLGFGLLDIFVVLWTGDILAAYALAALFLFPFRKLGPKTLVALGMACALWSAGWGLANYSERAALSGRVAVAQAHQRSGQALTPADTKALADWRTAAANRPGRSAEARAAIAAETVAHGGGALDYANIFWTAWLKIFWHGGLLFDVVFEAFCAMLIGVALWKWGVIQGQRSARFYAVMMAAGYAIGYPLRAIGYFGWVADDMAANLNWFDYEFVRLSIGLGHLGLINLVFKSRIGAAILSPFKAAGRIAFSLYFVEQIIGIHILFSPYGFDLWGRFGWNGMFWIATAMFFGLLIAANIWARYFVMGPMEWAWRSLAYLQPQPFRRRPVAGAT